MPAAEADTERAVTLRNRWRCSHIAARVRPASRMASIGRRPPACRPPRIDDGDRQRRQRARGHRRRRASESSSNNVGTVAAAAEETVELGAEISRQVARSSEIASKAVRRCASAPIPRSGAVDRRREDRRVVKLIHSIAAQTQPAALNATIEARVPAESGRGFAVVASEVKALANQTAKATEEISAAGRRHAGIHL